MSEIYLVGVDGSEGSRRALYFAAQAAQESGARLLVAHVLADTAGDDLAPHAPEIQVGQHDRELVEIQANMMEPLVAEARDLGVRIELVALRGDPASVLVELAADREASQIFIGRHGHSRVRELLFGSVLSSLTHKAAVPVTLVP